MNKKPPHPRTSASAKFPAPFPRRRIWPPAVLLLLALSSLLAMLVIYLFAHMNSPAPSQAAAQQPATQPSPPAFSDADRQTLAGRWVRPDGGYVLHVRTVDQNGNLDVAYFNPRPINVHKALASRDGPATRLFIELRDANYPGSTYNLTYDPQSDRLTGIYYQALLKQRFEVVFLRMR